MSPNQELNKLARTVARELAEQAGTSAVLLFADTLAGDVARFRARRELRRRAPWSTPEQREMAIEEVFTP